MKSSKLSLKNKIIHAIIAIPFLPVYLPFVVLGIGFLAAGVIFTSLHQAMVYFIRMIDDLYFSAVSGFNDK